MVYFLIKKTLGGAIEKEITQNEELAIELHEYLSEYLRKEKYTHLL